MGLRSSEAPAPGRGLIIAGLALIVVAVVGLAGHLWAANAATDRMFHGLRPVAVGRTVSFTATRSTRALFYSRADSLTCSATTSDGRRVNVGDGWPYLYRYGYGADAGIDVLAGRTYFISCSSTSSNARFAIAQLSVFNDEPMADAILVAPLLALIGIGLVFSAAIVRSRQRAVPDAGAGGRTMAGSPWPVPGSPESGASEPVGR